jgi:hypothetical protein
VHNSLSRRALVALTAACAAMALFAVQVSANGVISGKTKLKPDPDTFEALADMSIAVETTGKAEFKPTGAKFPVNGGDIDPTAGYQGIVGHQGGLRLTRSDGATVKFNRLFIEIEGRRGGRSKLTAFVAGEGLKLAALRDGQLAGTDTSFVLKNAEATLSKQGAEVLTETFDFPFRKGIRIGTTTTKATLTEDQVEE